MSDVCCSAQHQGQQQVLTHFTTSNTPHVCLFVNCEGGHGRDRSCHVLACGVTNSKQKKIVSFVGILCQKRIFVSGFWHAHMLRSVFRMQCTQPSYLDPVRCDYMLVRSMKSSESIFFFSNCCQHRSQASSATHHLEIVKNF